MMKRHDLNFAKFEKGMCFFEFAEKGSCKRHDTCWFSHEIPDEVRNDRDTKMRTSEALKKIEELRRTKEKPKLPIKIHTEYFLGHLRTMFKKKQAAHNIELPRLRHY